jgi:hypothetical protein
VAAPGGRPGRTLAGRLAVADALDCPTRAAGGGSTESHLDLSEPANLPRRARFVAA